MTSQAECKVTCVAGSQFVGILCEYNPRVLRVYSACAPRVLQVTLSNLFSVTEHFHPLHWHSGQHQLPGVFLNYDISGMKVELVEQHGASLSGTVARVCALVGGVTTVANIIDKIVYQSGHLLLKNRMGKLS